MSELKDKAKHSKCGATVLWSDKNGWYCPNCSSYVSESMVSIGFEDAQKEIDRVKELAKEATTIIIENERLLFKQKLQELFDVIDPRWTKYWSPKDKPHKEQTFLWLDYVRDWLVIREKFVELLEEEK